MSLVGCLPHLLMLLVFGVYFAMVKDRNAWPSAFVWWPWCLYAARVWLDHYFDGVQNTARNVARIYLLRRDGIGYDERLMRTIQMILVPDNLSWLSFLWSLSQIAAFTALLFFQGWAIALIAEGAIFVLPGLIPLRYQLHLRQIGNQLLTLQPRPLIALYASDVDVGDLVSVVEQAIRERRNPQQWWAEVLLEISKSAAQAAER